jgi:hypothetical protein
MGVGDDSGCTLGASLGGFLIELLGVRGSLIASGTSMAALGCGAAFYLRAGSWVKDAVLGHG